MAGDDREGNVRDGSQVTGWAWVHILAAASGLTVALLAATRGGGSKLAFPLALLAVDQFAWNLASVGTALTGDDRYAGLGAIAAPFFTPLAFHFVLRFLGRKHALRWWLRGAYLVFSLESALALVDLVSPWTVPGGVRTFSGILLATSLPLAALAFALVSRHLLQAPSALERWRARVLLLALVLVTVLLSTELVADLGVPVPRLATLGSFTFNLLLTLLTLGLGLFPRVTQRTATIAQAFLLGLFAAVAYLNLFVLFSQRLGVLITSSTALSLVLAAGGWFFLGASTRSRLRLERFATLGRFSAQMAHDLKNPLAAAKGAAQYLTEELRREGQAEREQFATLIVAQLDRLGAVIDRYQRLSKLEPERRPLELNELVERVLSLQAFAAGPVEWKRELHPGGLELSADGDLLASAVENLVKNAFEAMPDGGTLTVTTARREDDDGARAVLSVRDTGRGMDARAREQAFELFFTTKATGSGLGLAFVQQVASSHGGQVLLTSVEGSGTLVEVLLPLEGV